MALEDGYRDALGVPREKRLGDPHATVTRVYNMVSFSAVAFPDGTLEVSGVLGEELLVCKDETIGLRARSTWEPG